MVKAAVVCLLVVVCILSINPLRAAELQNWREATRDGEVAQQSDRMWEALKLFKSALADAEKEKVAATDPTFRTLVLEDLANMIEWLSLDKKNMERAEELANAKLACVKNLFGEGAPMELDAILDLQTLYSLQQKPVTALLLRYSGIVTKLRESGHDAEVTELEQFRKQRLNRKLKESFERIQKHFVPVNKVSAEDNKSDLAGSAAENANSKAENTRPKTDETPSSPSK